MKLFKHKKGHVAEETLKRIENSKSVSISEFNQNKTLAPSNIGPDTLEATKSLSLSADYICNYNTGDNIDGDEIPYRHIKEELNNRFKKLKSGSMQEGVNSTSDDDYGICVASPSPHISSTYASHSKIVAEALTKNALNKKGPSLTNISTHGENRSSNVPNISIMSRNSSENSSLESSSIGTWDSNLNSEYGNQPFNSCEDSEGSSFDLINGTNPHHGALNNANLKYDAAYHKISLKQKNRRSPQNKKPHHLAPMHLVNEFELPSMPEVSADFEHLEEQMIVTKQKENLSKLEKEGKFSCSKLVQSKDDMKNVMNAIELLKTNMSTMEEQDIYGSSRPGHHSPYHTLEYPEATHQNQVSKMIEEMKMRSCKKRQDERGDPKKGVPAREPAKNGKGDEGAKGTGGGFCLASIFKFSRKWDKTAKTAPTVPPKSKISPVKKTTKIASQSNPTTVPGDSCSPSKAKPPREGKKGAPEKKKEKRRLDFFCLKPGHNNNADEVISPVPHYKTDQIDSGNIADKNCAKMDENAKENETSGLAGEHNFNSRSVSLSMPAMPKSQAPQGATQSMATSTLDRKPYAIDRNAFPISQRESFKKESCPKNSTVSLNVDASQRAKHQGGDGKDKSDKNGFFARLRCSMRKRRGPEDKVEVGKMTTSILISSPQQPTPSLSLDHRPGAHKNWEFTDKRDSKPPGSSSKSTLDVRLIVEPTYELARRHSVCETPCVERRKLSDQSDQGGDDFPPPNFAVRSPLNYNFIFPDSHSPAPRTARVDGEGTNVGDTDCDAFRSAAIFKFEIESSEIGEKEQIVPDICDNSSHGEIRIQDINSSIHDDNRQASNWPEGQENPYGTGDFNDKVDVNCDFVGKGRRHCSDYSETYDQNLPVTTCFFSTLTQSSPLYITAPKSPLAQNLNNHSDYHPSVVYEISGITNTCELEGSIDQKYGIDKHDSPHYSNEKVLTSPVKYLDILIPDENEAQNGHLEQKSPKIDCGDMRIWQETPQLRVDQYVDNRLDHEQSINDHHSPTSPQASPIPFAHLQDYQSSSLRPASVDEDVLRGDHNGPASPNLALPNSNGPCIMSYSVHGLPPLPSSSSNGSSAPIMTRSIVPGLRMGCLSPAGTTKISAGGPAFFANSSRCGLRNYSDLICHTRKVSSMLTQRRNNFLELNSDLSPDENQSHCVVKADQNTEDQLEKYHRGSIIDDFSSKTDLTAPKQLWLSRETLEFRTGSDFVDPSDGATMGQGNGVRPQTLPADLRSQKNELLKAVAHHSIEAPPLTYPRPKSHEFNLLSPQDIAGNRFRSNSVQGKFSQIVENTKEDGDVKEEKSIDPQPTVVAPRKRVKDMINTFQKLSSQN